MSDSSARKLHLFSCFAHMERIFIFNRNLKRISLLVVDETGMSASSVPNMYEIILELSLVSAFQCIEIADCLCIGVSDGLFHKLW